MRWASPLSGPSGCTVSPAGGPGPALTALGDRGGWSMALSQGTGGRELCSEEPGAHAGPRGFSTGWRPRPHGEAEQVCISMGVWPLSGTGVGGAGGLWTAPLQVPLRPASSGCACTRTHTCVYEVVGPTTALLGAWDLDLPTAGRSPCDLPCLRPPLSFLLVSQNGPKRKG